MKLLTEGVSVSFTSLGDDPTLTGALCVETKRFITNRL